MVRALPAQDQEQKEQHEQEDDRSAGDRNEVVPLGEPVRGEEKAHVFIIPGPLATIAVP